MEPLKIVILADIPLCKFECLKKNADLGNCNATWFEALIPEFEHRKDLEIHWITMSKGTKVVSCERAYGQTFHILPRRKKLFSMLTAYRFESYSIKKKIKQIKPDLIHAWGVEDVYGLTGSRLKYEPKLFSLQGCLSACLKVDSGLSWLFRLQAFFEKPTVTSFAHATGESPISTGHLKRMNPKIKTYQIEYGVSLDFHEAVWNPVIVPSVLYAGSVTRAKGICDLLEAFSQEGMEHITLSIAGDGSMREELEAETPDNVKWLGKLSRAELIEEMSNSWALVIPTYADTGPSVVKEARVVGLPIITTTAAGSSTYIDHKKSGFIISPGDISSLSDAIKELCSSRESCIMKGNHGHSEIRRELQPSLTAERFSELYRKLVE